MRRLALALTRPLVTSSHHIHAVKPFTTTRLITMSSSRSYTEALAQLNTLVPNLKIHALFNTPKPTSSPSTTTTTAAAATKNADPNALAIPEMRAWLTRAALTPSQLSTMSYIHVAGTKGKGSVTALTTAALLSSTPGPVGTYTSPHLVSPRERIAINGAPVSQSLFADHFFRLWDSLSAQPADAALGIEAGSKPFYFRFLTLLALRIFLAEGVRSAVIECGIGGEHDATNILPAGAVTASIITQLGIDHVAMLGSTAESIAWHKAGVMKPRVPTFTRLMPHQPGVMSVLRTRAAETAAELVQVADDTVTSWTGVPGAKLPGGEFQKRNQALAALAAHHHTQLLQGKTTRPSSSLDHVPDAIIAGLREATLRGRHEVIHHGSVAWHLDGAHNEDSLAEVARWIAPLIAAEGDRLVLVFNQQERDASGLLLGFLRQLGELGADIRGKLAHAIFTRNDATRVQDADLRVQQKCAEALAAAFPGVTTSVCADLAEMKSVVDHVTASSRQAGHEVKVLVTGSMYLVGNTIGFLEPDSLS
ncbi:Folylpolyglutamate synthase [Colletotrichum trifolii]|uniref:tetrahydrofolate synthase n=1 Tax=Colletotrichum trifolii TaxID=5466 RepID=A0A4R8QUJ5_COLTR|nr:Folylpolyglutamate synthase [Colletotrichum trifolii]